VASKEFCLTIINSLKVQSKVTCGHAASGSAYSIIEMWN